MDTDSLAMACKVMEMAFSLPKTLLSLLGIGKAKQIEAAIVEVTLGEGGIGFGQADGELVEVAVGGFTQGHEVVFAQGIVLIIHAVHLRLKLSFVHPLHDEMADGFVVER